MNHFNVLSQDIPLYTSHFIEASAGTGKTFSIQHLFGRFLVEPSPKTGQPTPLKKILVVTFTNAATDELFSRIQKHLIDLVSTLREETFPSPKFPYLKNSSNPEVLKRTVEEALYHFEECQIFTIHGCCSRLLSLFDPNYTYTQEIKGGKIIYEGVRDFLRTTPSYQWISPQQIDILLSYFKNNFHDLALFIGRLLEKDQERETPLEFNEGASAFCNLLKKAPPFDSLELKALFSAFKKGEFKGIFKINLDKGIAELIRMRSLEGSPLILFEEGISLFSDLISSIKPENILARTQLKPLESPLYPVLKEIAEFVLPYSDPLSLAALLTQKISPYLKERMEEIGEFSPDSLLNKVRSLSYTHEFASLASSEYEVVIVDEFQDTDPVQWDIFKNLFSEKTLYLVGDPKQAIYSFRNADIYTYLDAGTQLKGNKGALSKNYRSSKNLTGALNSLFHGESNGAWLPLPKIESHFVVSQVEALEDSPTLPTPSLSLLLLEGNLKTQMEPSAWNWFVEKLNLLTANGDHKLDQFAVLVKDKNQAARAQEFLTKKEIPSITRKTKPIWEGKAYAAMVTLLDAALHPKSLSKMKLLLLTPLFGKSHDELLFMEESGELQNLLFSFSKIQYLLFNKGFASFVEALMQISPNKRFSSLPEFILSQEGGENFYLEWQQLVHHALEIQSRKGKSPERLFLELKAFPSESIEEKPHLKVEQDGEKNALQILTLHGSKGLEFDFVFPIGLLDSSKPSDDFVEKEGKFVSSKLNSSAFEALCAEKNGEKLRLFYVALTRAKKGLFLPLGRRSGKKLSGGELSPTELFILLLMFPHENLSESLYEKLFSFSKSELEEKLKAQLDKSDFEIGTSPEGEVPYLSQIEPKISLQSIKLPKISRDEIYSQSFTSLSAQITKKTKKTTNLKESSSGSAFDLPLGSETGTLLHTLLEKTNFASGPSEVTCSKIIRGTLLEPFLPPIMKMLQNLFKAPILTEVTSPIFLSQIPESQLWKEMEFIFPTESKLSIENAQLENGYLKGFIDLFFEWEDTFFVIDWKSNFLGASIEDYSFHNLEKEMEEKGYHLQSAIYETAIKKYLSKWGLEKKFGGVIFIFLRPYGEDQLLHPYVFKRSSDACFS